jgi:hypothetical protein
LRRDEQVSGARIRELINAQPPAELDPTTEQLLEEQEQQPQVRSAEHLGKCAHAHAACSHLRNTQMTYGTHTSLQVTTAGEASFRAGAGSSGTATFQQPVVSTVVTSTGHV